jgi:hypothetical protein
MWFDARALHSMLSPWDRRAYIAVEVSEKNLGDHQSLDGFC